MNRKQRLIGAVALVAAAVIAVPAGVLWRAARQQALDHRLIAAIKRDDEPGALRALAEGADANAPDAPPLPIRQVIWSLLHGQRPPVSTAPTPMIVLLAPSGLDEQDGPLHDRPTIVRALIAHGANVTQTDNNGHSPLFWALFYKCSTETAELLIGHGANVVDPISDDSMLAHAIRYHNPVATIDLILQHGANVNEPDDFGSYPLSLAIQNRDASTVRCLLRRHADPNRTSEVSTWNARPAVKSIKPLAYAERFHLAEIARLLRDAGAK